MLFFFINRVLINHATHYVSIRAGFSKLMANTGSSDGNQSQEGDLGLQAIRRSINKQEQSIQNLTQ